MWRSHQPNKISQPLAAIMAVFARVRARPRVRAPRGVDHRAGRRRLHEQHGSRLSAKLGRGDGS